MAGGELAGGPGRTEGEVVRAAIGRWIRQQREHQDLTQEDLCRALARRGVTVSPSTISRWETGRQSPSAEVLALVGLELGRSLASLQEQIGAALARSREEVDLTGQDAAALVAEADRAARAGNYPRALAYLEAADDHLRLEEKQPEPDFLAGLLLRLAMAHMNLWHLDLAGEALARYGRVAREAPQLRFRGLVFRTYHLVRAKDWRGVELLEKRVLEGLDGQPGRVRAEALVVLGIASYRRKDYVKAVQLLSAAREAWSGLSIRVEEARTGAYEGYCLARDDRPEDGERRLLASLGTARKFGYRDVEVLALHFLGRLQGLVGHSDEAVHNLLQAAERARSIGLREAEFQAIYRAWEMVGGDEFEKRLRRLLREVSPMVEEVQEFRRRISPPDVRIEEDQP